MNGWGDARHARCAATAGPPGGCLPGGSPPATWRRFRLAGMLWAACALAGLTCGGCTLRGQRPEHLDTRYGSRVEQRGGQTSVNGTGVLAELFRRAGHRVSTVAQLYPGVGRRAQCIVHVPDDFMHPDDRATDWVYAWLSQGSNRTYIFVVRDFDAACWYWEQYAAAASGSPAQTAVQQQAAAMRQAFESERPTDARPLLRTFVVDYALRRRDVRSLDGDPSWWYSVDESKLGIELNGRLRLAPLAGGNVDQLLGSQGDALVLRRRVGNGQLIVVANGSFLLNLPLVNHEHRKLATRLIDEVGVPGYVVFLEGSGNPVVLDKDPAVRFPSVLSYLDVHPIHYALWHLVLLAVLLLLARFPIFGRPRDDAQRAPGDFGLHVAALGALMARTHDESYARERVLHYQHHVKPEQDRHRGLAHAARRRRRQFV
jgi:hypothetical protein